MGENGVEIIFGETVKNIVFEKVDKTHKEIQHIRVKRIVSLLFHRLFYSVSYLFLVCCNCFPPLSD